jgi:hypothetical protein
MKLTKTNLSTSNVIKYRLMIIIIIIIGTETTEDQYSHTPKSVTQHEDKFYGINEYKRLDKF